MRKGEKFFKFAVPIDLLTLAPAPSDCSMARNAFRIALGTVMFADFGIPYIDLGGKRGSPLKAVVLVFLISSVIVSSSVRRLSLNATARNAIVIEKTRKRTFMEIEGSFIEDENQRTILSLRDEGLNLKVMESTGLAL